MHEKQKTEQKKIQPNPFLQNSFKLEAHRILSGMIFLVSGVSGITQLTEESIHLTLKGGRVVIEGKRLSLTALENKTVEINGTVEEIKFKYVKIKA